MHQSKWQVIVLTLTSVCLPFLGNAAEVIVSVDQQSNAPHIRTLAASCAACHGSNGSSAGTTPSIAGLDGAYFTTQMLAFKNGDRAATVMHRHAKGLNVDEINLLAAYFSTQKKTVAISPKPEMLQVNQNESNYD
jgi:cytochrome subunit of sulfide dehydrogenase